MSDDDGLYIRHTCRYEPPERRILPCQGCSEEQKSREELPYADAIIAKDPDCPLCITGTGPTRIQARNWNDRVGWPVHITGPGHSDFRWCSKDGLPR